MTYHSREIQKGVFGEVSKIREELEELEDSENMGQVLQRILTRKRTLRV